MLEEVKNTSQIKGEGSRRWFSDSSFDLYIWEDGAGHIDGFQLCYGKGVNEHAFTWRNSGSCTHHKVDDGEYPGLDYKSSPILVPDGHFDALALAKNFKAQGKNIDPVLSDFVCQKLIEWRNRFEQE